jgi:hypothetical protein
MEKAINCGSLRRRCDDPDVKHPVARTCGATATTWQILLLYSPFNISPVNFTLPVAKSHVSIKEKQECKSGGIMRVAAGALCLAAVLSGCYPSDRRYGIEPVLNPVAVQTSSNNQTLILTALARDANLGAATAADWYQIAEAGFNFVDDECRLYFNELFFLNRDRERNKSLLISGAATTAAILAATGASQMSMGIVAQAFGFGGIANELVAGTYLYQLPPATTLGFVKELQLAYREGAANRRALITNAPAAYHAIQDYLTLCLPPTIEAKMSEHIGTARAFPDSSRGNQSTSFGITLTSPVPVTRQEIRAAVGADTAAAPARLRQGSDVVKPTGGVVNVDPGTKPEDIAASRDDWIQYRATLCVTGENTLGPKTRQALKLFKAAVNDKLSENVTDNFTKRELNLIEEARIKFPSCAQGGPKPPRNAFEVGIYTLASSDEVNSVLRKALALAKTAKPDIYSPAPTDIFDTDRAVKELRSLYAIDALSGTQTSELDDRFWSRARKRR